MSGGITRQIDIIVRRDLDPAAAALDFARRARADLQDEIDAGRVPERFRRYVDGRANAAEATVRPGGTILYEFSMMAEVVVFALAFLRARSPTGTMSASRWEHKAEYRDSFFVSVNGGLIPAGEVRPELVPDDAEIFIGNFAPFNRKIDVQFVGKRRLTFNQPPNLYADAARAVKASFGNFVTATRVFSLDFPGRYKLRQAQVRASGRGTSIKRHAGEFVDSPALAINPR